jgi:hypothetical protein
LRESPLVDWARLAFLAFLKSLAKGKATGKQPLALHWSILQPQETKKDRFLAGKI